MVGCSPCHRGTRWSEAAAEKFQVFPVVYRALRQLSLLMKCLNERTLDYRLGLLCGSTEVAWQLVEWPE